MMPSKPCIMVCVTGQHSCDRLVKRALERAAAYDPPATVNMVHCVETGHHFMNSPYESDAVEYLFTAAQLAGAQLSLLRADDIDDALVNYANECGATMIIMGAPGSKQQQRETIDLRLQHRLPQIEFDIVPLR